MSVSFAARELIMSRCAWLNLLGYRQRFLIVCQLLAATIVLQFSEVACSEQQFPYVAYITKPNVYVRSGPSQRYYPTQQLPQGHAVEVYRHDGDRWCAIRPPEGSFSLVSIRQVNQLGQDIAEISGNQTVSRVGSLLTNNSSAIQVLLPRGERVKVVGNATDDGKYLRIAPPAGEFRWVAAEDLSAQPPVESSAPTYANSGGWKKPGEVSPNPQQQPGAFRHLSETTNVLHDSESITIPKSAGLVEQELPGEGAVNVVQGSPAEIQLAQFQAQGLNLQEPNAEATFPPIPTNTTNSDIANQQTMAKAPRVRFEGLSRAQAPAPPRVAELDLRLSEIVIRPPADWQFAQLKSEAESLIAATDSPEERSSLRNLIDKIARFEQVQQGYTATSPIVSQASTSTSANPNYADTSSTIDEKPEGFTGRTADVLQRVKEDLGGASVASNASGDEDVPRYDAVGILKPVVSKREQAPRFALIDDRGDVVSFVTPTPDLNLQPYLGQRIGVHGKREYISEFRKAHVAAGRITPIEGRIRR